MQRDENKFTALLRRHLDNQAAAEEALELMSMIKSGLYDRQLKQIIDQSLQNEPAERDLTMHAAHRLLHKILSSEEQTAQLIPTTKPPVKFGPWLAAAAVFLVMLTGWWIWHARTNKDLARSATSPMQRPPETGKGKFIRLPDGSTVLLNNGSKLDYAQIFNSRSREVTLTGEAYFDVKKDDKRPFMVHTGKVNTTVLGTAFNILAWPGQQDIVVTVAHGKVQVNYNKKFYGIITSNQQIAVNTATDGFSNQEVNAESAISWKKDYLVLDDISFEEAARLISDKYQVSLVLANDEMKKCTINATFLSHENLEQVLNVVCAVMNAAYTRRPNNQIVIEGKGCN